MNRNVLLWCQLALACALGAGAAAPARALTPPAPQQAIEAVPYYQPSHFVVGLLQHMSLPRVQALQAASSRLLDGTQALCAAPPARQAAARLGAREHWQRTALAWDQLAPVAIGPMLQRRSLRQIDFWPSRPALIERAIRAAPASAADMERVGTPAKGLPALEWLLWVRKAPLDAPACRYAVQVAAEIDREAEALAQRFTALASAPPDDLAAMMAEAVNQWVGGLERLRWAQIEKPLRSGSAVPRAASGTTVASWQAQWHTLRALAVQEAAHAPAPGQGLVSLETYLRGRGLIGLADRLRRSVLRADPAVAALNAHSHPTQLAAARELSAVKRLVEGDVADALEVSMGFSDADGD